MSLLGNKVPGESQATTVVVLMVAMTLGKTQAVAAEVRDTKKKKKYDFSKVAQGKPHYC